MIRKVIIVMLIMAAVGTGVLWAGQHDLRWNVMGIHNVAAFFPGWTVVLVYVPHDIAENRFASAGCFGFGYRRTTVFYPTEQHKQVDWYLAWFPAWLLVLLFATYPTFALIRGPLRRYRRRRKGLCTRCGYNLTGNVSGVCPECGSRTTKGPAMEIEH